MATLVGAIIDQYANGVGANSDTLRTALGTGKMFSDVADEGTAMPYCVLSEGVQTLIAAGKGNSYQLFRCPIQFDVYSVGKAKADEVLDALQELFTAGSPQLALTITNRIHLGTEFSFRNTFKDPMQTVWHGAMELFFEVQK